MWEGGNVSNKLLSEHGKTESHPFCCPRSTPLHLYPSCAWPLVTDLYLVPFSFPLWDCTEQHCIWKLIVQHCPAQAVQKHEWLCMDPEPSEVASPDMWFLTNFIVFVTGWRITEVEKQDMKLGWEWLRRSFHHIMEFVLFMFLIWIQLCLFSIIALSMPSCQIKWSLQSENI